MSKENLDKESGAEEYKEVIKDKNEPKILSSRNCKSYLIVLAIMLGITVIYHIFYNIVAGPISGGPPSPPSPHISTSLSSSINTIVSFNQPVNGAGTTLSDIWPLWGYFSIPTLFGIIVCIVVCVIFILLIVYFYGKLHMNLPLVLITIIGIILIIGTNLIQGWTLGIENPIGGVTEILTDAVNINDPFAFIVNFEEIQSTLSIHAQTQPPGAVLIIYLLYVVFRAPGMIAIALCILATMLSVYFTKGIYQRIFDKKLSNYTIFLFLLLPAIQVYYLANIYAIVSSLLFGVVYFYLHPRRKTSIMGSICCIFFLSFMTFLFVYIVIFLFLFELLKAYRDGFFKKSYIQGKGILNWMRSLLIRGQKLIILAMSLVIIYFLFLIVGFNYVNAFLYASSTTSGFTLFSNPLNYFVTRLQNVLDILIFFGPILTVLCYRGIKNLKQEYLRGTELSTTYLLVTSALFALLILFLAGAPNKGETARICMFILPFLLVPVAYELQKQNYAQIERIKLLAIVFGQTVLFQLIAIWVW